MLRHSLFFAAVGILPSSSSSSSTSLITARTMLSTTTRTTTAAAGLLSYLVVVVPAISTAAVLAAVGSFSTSVVVLPQPLLYAAAAAVAGSSNGGGGCCSCCCFAFRPRGNSRQRQQRFYCRRALSTTTSASSSSSSIFLASQPSEEEVGGSGSDNDRQVDKSAVGSPAARNTTMSTTTTSSWSSLSVPLRLVTLIGSTTSTAVAGTFFAVLAWKRDALLVSFFIGAIANGVLSKVLKKIIDQSRPHELHRSDLVSLKPSDGGMPSSHAMSLGFIGIFTALCLPPWTIAVRLPLLLYVAASLCYRVAVTKLHTKEQIAVGLLLGTANGAIWHRLCCGVGPGGSGVAAAGGGGGIVASWVSSNFLDSTGHLPVPFLAVPALLGLVVVGSFERRISRWVKNKKAKDG